MKVYAGWMDAGRNAHVTVDGQPLRVVEYHADEFAWAYGGSGPATLALSILADYFGETHVDNAYLLGMGIAQRTPLSWHFHQDFKRDFVAGWGSGEQGRWQLTETEIAARLVLQPPYLSDEPEMDL